jgi:hypothetical protein
LSFVEYIILLSKSALRQIYNKLHQLYSEQSDDAADRKIWANVDGLLLCLNFITVSREPKPNKIADVEVNNKCSVENRRWGYQLKALRYCWCCALAL